MIDYFSSKPLGDKYANYYPPMKQYNSLLRKLRFLGIYQDEHMVSQKVFFSCEHIQVYKFEFKGSVQHVQKGHLPW